MSSLNGTEAVRCVLKAVEFKAHITSSVVIHPYRKRRDSF